MDVFFSVYAHPQILPLLKGAERGKKAPTEVRATKKGEKRKEKHK